MKKYLVVCILLLVGIGVCSGCSKKDEQKEIKVITAEDDLKKLVTSAVKAGADKANDVFPQLDFASENRIMFHNQNVFFAFDCKEQKITSAVNLKEMGLFSLKDGYEAKILVSEDGNLVRMYQTQGEETQKDYFLQVDNNKITTKKQAFDDIYQGDFNEDYKKDVFAGKDVRKIKEALTMSGLNDSNVLVQNDQSLVYLAYPADVFVEAEDEFKNLSLMFYDALSGAYESMPVFKGFVTLDTKKDAENLDTEDSKVWMKRSSDGVLYFDVDALKGTKAATGEFGTLVVGNVFRSQTGILTVTINNIDEFDTSLEPELWFNQVDEKEEPQSVKITKNKKTYTFKNLKPNDYYFIDCYPTKDIESDQQLKQVDDNNAKISVTISN